MKKEKKDEERWLKKANFKKKKKRKAEETKIKEKEMWERLTKLNGDFKDIKKAKKRIKKNVWNNYKLA